MCSTDPQRIAEIGKALDELAAEAAEKPGRAGQTSDPADASNADVSAASVSDTDRVVIRLAQLWAQLAELDPEVARRLPRYQA
jgi:hypothetical protein